MKVANGNVVILKTDLDEFERRGFMVSMHTESYTNGITVKMIDGTEIGFYNWLDNAECYVGDTRVVIKDIHHLTRFIDMMDAIVNFNSRVAN